VTENSKHPKPQRKIFNLSWEKEAEPTDTPDKQNDEQGSDEDDFEGHASGFNRPEEF
jgi:hypothetical protein